MTTTANSGDVLVRALCNGQEGIDAHDLLLAIYAGYPASCVRDLIDSGRSAALKAAAWLLSELGEQAGPMHGEVCALLDCDLAYARFFAVDAALRVGRSEDGELLAKAASLVRDPESSVRWKAMGFLAHARSDQLDAALEVASGPFRELLGWLVGLDGEPVATVLDEVSSRLLASDGLVRLVAAAAAARVSSVSPEPLSLAIGSADAEVADFASTERARLGPR